MLFARDSILLPVIYPTHDELRHASELLRAGRLVAFGLMIGGIALLGTVTATLASWLVETVAAEKEQAEDLQVTVRRFSPVAENGPRADLKGNLRGMQVQGDVNQTLAGRMLGYGNIVVTGSGGTTETFCDIQAPLEFRRAVQSVTDVQAIPVEHASRIPASD